MGEAKNKSSHTPHLQHGLLDVVEAEGLVAHHARVTLPHELVYHFFFKDQPPTEA